MDLPARRTCGASDGLIYDAFLLRRRISWHGVIRKGGWIIAGRMVHLEVGGELLDCSMAISVACRNVFRRGRICASLFPWS